MTFPTKDELLAGLSTVRENICAYHGGFPCRCKHVPTASKNGVSEHTGCPEVRCAFALLKVLTWDEYEGFVRRVNGAAAAKEPESEDPTWRLLSDLTIGEAFKTRTGRVGTRAEGEGRQSIYLRVQWEDGGSSFEPPSTPVWPIKTMRIATLPVPGLFDRLREMGARVERESLRYSEVRLSIRIGDDPKKHWSSYENNFSGLANLIAFAKAHVPGPWFVDLEPEDAKSLWKAIGVVEQTQLRALRPQDAPPGFMFSFCGVDVCERQP